MQFVGTIPEGQIVDQDEAKASKFGPWVTSPEGHRIRSRGFMRDNSGALAIGALGLILTVVGGIVVFLILGNMADPFFDALGTLLTAFIDVELGSNTVANTTEIIIESLAYVVGVGGALFLVGYAVRATGVGRKG